MKNLIHSSVGNKISNSLVKIVITAIASFMLASCAKEPLTPVNGVSPDYSQSKVATTAAAKVAPAVTYNACGMSVKVFAPSAFSTNMYSFAYTISGQQKKFGITGTAGRLDFTNYDKFNFEDAGYLDAAKAVKGWKIRRTDGKYLTTGLTYGAKLTGTREAEQIFLLASLGNNQYKILLPKLNSCNIAAIWNDIDLGYRIANFVYNDSRLASRDTKVTMTVVPLETY